MEKFIDVSGLDPETKLRKTLKVNTRFITAVGESTGEVIGTRMNKGRLWAGEALLLYNPNIYLDRVLDEIPGCYRGGGGLIVV